MALRVAPSGRPASSWCWRRACRCRAGRAARPILARKRVKPAAALPIRVQNRRRRSRSRRPSSSSRRWRSSSIACARARRLRPAVERCSKVSPGGSPRAGVVLPACGARVEGQHADAGQGGQLSQADPGRPAVTHRRSGSARPADVRPPSAGAVGVAPSERRGHLVANPVVAALASLQHVGPLGPIRTSTTSDRLSSRSITATKSSP